MQQLIDYLKAERGRLSKLATALEITPAAIKQWEMVPADKLVRIETETGIPRQQLRPDLYDGMKKPRRSSQVSA